MTTEKRQARISASWDQAIAAAEAAEGMRPVIVSAGARAAAGGGSTSTPVGRKPVADSWTDAIAQMHIEEGVAVAPRHAATSLQAGGAAEQTPSSPPAAGGGLLSPWPAAGAAIPPAQKKRKKLKLKKAGTPGARARALAPLNPYMTEARTNRRLEQQYADILARARPGDGSRQRVEMLAAAGDAAARKVLGMPPRPSLRAARSITAQAGRRMPAGDGFFEEVRQQLDRIEAKVAG